jgi:hypothetical protein
VTFGYDINDPYGPRTDWSSSGQEIRDSGEISPALSETGVRGSLTPTEASTGNTFTYTWSSPYLQGLNLTAISTMTNGGSGLVNNYLGQLGIGPLYFAGFTAKPPPPTVPTNYSNPQLRPYVLTISGDGSWFFGGRTGHRLEPRNLKRIGRLHWTQYTATTASATGEVWGLYGRGSFSADRQFEAEGTVSLHLYRPVNGVFTRMSVRLGRSTYRAADGQTFHDRASTSTVNATQSDGDWYW